MPSLNIVYIDVKINNIIVDPGCECTHQLLIGSTPSALGYILVENNCIMQSLWHKQKLIWSVLHFNVLFLVFHYTMNTINETWNIV